MIIKLKSDNDSVIYDGVSGDTLETSSSLVIPGAPLVTGSVVKVTIWTMKTNEGDIQSLCQFETDGKMISSRSVILNGSDIIPTIYVNEMEHINVKVTLDEKNINTDHGFNRAGKNHYCYQDFAKPLKFQILYFVRLML